MSREVQRTLNTINHFIKKVGGEPEVHILPDGSAELLFSNNKRVVPVTYGRPGGHHRWQYSSLYINPSLDYLNKHVYSMTSLDDACTAISNEVFGETGGTTETYLPRFSHFDLILERQGLGSEILHFVSELSTTLQDSKTKLSDLEIHSCNFSGDNNFVIMRTAKGPFDRPSLIWVPAMKGRPSHWEARQNCLDERFNGGITIENAVRLLKLSNYLSPNRSSDRSDEVVNAFDSFVTKRSFSHNPAGLAETYLEFGKNGEGDTLYVIERRSKKAVKKYVEGSGWYRPDKRFKYRYWWEVKNWTLDKVLV